MLVSKTWLTTKFEVSTFLAWVFVYGKDGDSPESRSQSSSLLMSILAQNFSLSSKLFLSETFLTTIFDSFLIFCIWNENATLFNSKVFTAPKLFYNLFKSAYYNFHSMQEIVIYFFNLGPNIFNIKFIYKPFHFNMYLRSA